MNAIQWQSPVGMVYILEQDGFIHELGFGELPAEATVHESEVLQEARRQLEQYFAGKRKHFELPLSLSGTDFQLAVWAALQNIPYGETRSYQQIAAEVGNEKAVRAVGGANNKNRLAIIIPCHRVIGKNGKLVGYAGGMDFKEFLLALERSHA